MPVHSPHFSEHGPVGHREAGGQQPGARGAEPGEVPRLHPAAVDAERHGCAQADAAAAQHYSVARGMRPLYYPGRVTLK